jgi:hypothetical protein
MREDITFGSSSARSDVAVGRIELTFAAIQPAVGRTHRVHTLPRCRQGKANLPISGTALLNNPICPL